MTKPSDPINTPSGRRYFYPGKKLGYPSVTTIISAAWPSDYLEAWKTRNIAKAIIANVEDMSERLERIKSRPPKMRELYSERLGETLLDWRDDHTAADRGTRIHEGLELLLTGQLSAKKLKKTMRPEEYVQTLTAADALHRLGFQPMYVEAQVFHHGMKYAGTADLIGTYTRIVRGKKRKYVTCVDLKTGKRINRYFAAQLAAYSYAEELLTGVGDVIEMPKVKNALVLHVVAGKAQFYRVNLSHGWEDFQACERIYRSANSTGGLKEYDV